MAGSYAPPKGLLFVDPYSRPIQNGAVLPGSYRYFYIHNTLTPATVYQDGLLQNPYLLGAPIVSDANGVFPPIYLDTSVMYRMQLYNAAATLLEDIDPVQEQPPSLAASVLSAAITTSGTSLTSTGLTVNVPQAGIYTFESYLEFTATVGSPAVSLQYNFSGTLQANSTNSGPTLGPIGSATFTINSTGSLGSISGSQKGAYVSGSFYATSVGALVLQWEVASGATTAQLNAGSYLLLQPASWPNATGSTQVSTVGILFKEPVNQPQNPNGGASSQEIPGSYRQFYFSGTNVLAPVYADAGLQRPIAQLPGQAPFSCSAQGDGALSPIYLDPSLAYRVILFSAPTTLNGVGTQLQLTDPYVPRAWEPITAVKYAPTFRPLGAPAVSDPALQITLNSGTYQLESMLEFATGAITPNTLTTAVSFVVTAGASANIITSNTASSVATAVVTLTSGFAIVGGSQSLSLPSANSLLEFLMHGVIVVSGGSITLGVAWAPAGTAGNVELNAGSFLMARRIS